MQKSGENVNRLNNNMREMNHVHQDDEGEGNANNFGFRENNNQARFRAFQGQGHRLG